MPEAQRQQLALYLASCSAIAPEFRWTAAANLHLTVRFVGSVDRSIADGIANRLQEAALSGFELGLGEVGTFRRGRMVRVVWLQVSMGAEPARELAALVEAACVRSGLNPELRAFQPHLTLARARAREGSALPELPSTPTDLPPWRAEELVLYSSHLGRGGSVYELLRVLSLR